MSTNYYKHILIESEGNKMFNNLGHKIKALAKIIFFIVCIIAAILCFMGIAEEELFTALVIPIIIILIYLPIVWGIAGLGDLISNSEKQNELLRQNNELLKQAITGDTNVKNIEKGDSLPKL